MGELTVRVVLAIGVDASRRVHSDELNYILYQCLTLCVLITRTIVHELGSCSTMVEPPTSPDHTVKYSSVDASMKRSPGLISGQVRTRVLLNPVQLMRSRLQVWWGSTWLR